MDLNDWTAEHVAHLPVDWVVSTETIEHLDNPLAVVEEMQKAARVGVCLTTPNPATHDVRATDPTHVTPVCREDLADWGFTVFEAEFSGRGKDGQGDTLVGVWLAPDAGSGAD
jgi:2-polyprenyl-3-methyl-5-hydroxy-6-metoxy-1,4-benzoquinol methylase